MSSASMVADLDLPVDLGVTSGGRVAVAHVLQPDLRKPGRLDDAGEAPGAGQLAAPHARGGFQDPEREEAIGPGALQERQSRYDLAIIGHFGGLIGV